MRIGIDVSVLSNVTTGVENYTLKLIQGLSQVDSLNRYILFSNTDEGRCKLFQLPLSSGPDKTDPYDLPLPETERLSRNFSIKTSHSFPNRPLWRQLAIPSLAADSKVRVLHSPFMSFPIMGKFKKVITVHDLYWLKISSFRDMGTYLKYKFWMRAASRMADRIITISQSTKNDILNLIPHIDEKIDVILWAAGKEHKVLYDMEKVSAVRNRYRIEGHMILTVSLMRPRKNMSHLISAFSILKSSHKTQAKLVIVGGKTHIYNNLVKQCHKLNIVDDVIFAGHMTTTELVYMYNAADLFVLPSLYEGFGLPVLEAMACGTPVITSNISSLPEVAGNAAILVNPYDVEELAHAMYKVLDNKGLKRILIEKGLRRAKMFSWEKTARKTLEVYRQVAEQ